MHHQRKTPGDGVSRGSTVPGEYNIHFTALETPLEDLVHGVTHDWVDHRDFVQGVPPPAVREVRADPLVSEAENPDFEIVAGSSAFAILEGASEYLKCYVQAFVVQCLESVADRTTLDALLPDLVQSALQFAQSHGLPNLAEEASKYVTFSARAGDAFLLKDASDDLMLVGPRSDFNGISVSEVFLNHDRWVSCDFGECLRLNPHIASQLRVDADWEPRQCFVLHLAAAALFFAEGSKQLAPEVGHRLTPNALRLPTPDEVQRQALGYRNEMFTAARRISASLGNVSASDTVTRSMAELRTFVHDWEQFAHDRDYRSLEVLAPEAAWSQPIIFYRTTPERSYVTHVFTPEDSQKATRPWTFLLHRGHMTLLIPSAKGVRMVDADIDSAPLQSEMTGWEAFLARDGPWGAHTPVKSLVPCSWCKAPHIRVPATYYTGSGVPVVHDDLGGMAAGVSAKAGMTTAVGGVQSDSDISVPDSAWKVGEEIARLYHDNRTFEKVIAVRVIELADRLVEQLGGYVSAVRVFRASWDRLFGSNMTMSGVDSVKWSLSEELKHILEAHARDGVKMAYVGPKWRLKAKLYPKALQHMDECVEKLWKDVREGRVLLISSRVEMFLGGEAPDGSPPVMSCPMNRVPKYLPDRTMSADGRFVADLRFPVNLGTPSTRVRKVVFPTHQQVQRRMLALKLKWPGIRIEIAKVDVDAAFKRIWMNAEEAGMFVSEMPGESFGVPGCDILTLFLVLVFGWTCSPSAYMCWAEGIAMHHQACKPAIGYCKDPFQGYTLMDDGILIEPAIHGRSAASMTAYVHGLKALLGNDAVNKDKHEEEGKFEVERIVWGILYNTEKCTRALPRAKLLKAELLLQESVYDFGSKVVTLHDLQVLRGNGTYWSVVFPQVASELGVVDILLSLLNSESHHVVPEGVWLQFWESMEALRMLVSVPELWESQWVSPLHQVLRPQELVSLPQYKDRVRWVATDATLDMFAGIDWKGKMVVRCKVTDFVRVLEDLIGQENVTDTIALAEFLGFLVSLTAFCNENHADFKGSLVIHVCDNMNVVQWVESRYSKCPVVRVMLRWLMRLESIYSLLVVSTYTRTYHNKSPDLLTRCTDEEAKRFLAMRGMSYVQTRRLWHACLENLTEGLMVGPAEGRDAIALAKQLKDRRCPSAVARPLSTLSSTLQGCSIVELNAGLGSFSRIAKTCGALLHYLSIPADGSGCPEAWDFCVRDFETPLGPWVIFANAKNETELKGAMQWIRGRRGFKAFACDVAGHVPWNALQNAVKSCKEHGLHTWVERINTADFGDNQSRWRLLFLASSVGCIEFYTPSRRAGHVNHVLDKLEDIPKDAWLSMSGSFTFAPALGGIRNGPRVLGLFDCDPIMQVGAVVSCETHGRGRVIQMGSNPRIMASDKSWNCCPDASVLKQRFGIASMAHPARQVRTWGEPPHGAGGALYLDQREVKLGIRSLTYPEIMRLQGASEDDITLWRAGCNIAFLAAGRGVPPKYGNDIVQWMSSEWCKTRVGMHDDPFNKVFLEMVHRPQVRFAAHQATDTHGTTRQAAPRFEGSSQNPEIFGGALQKTMDSARELVMGKLSRGTQKVYQTGWRDWVEFACTFRSGLTDVRDRPYLETSTTQRKRESEDALLAFVVYLRRVHGRSYTTIKNKLYSVRFWHLATGMADVLIGCTRLFWCLSSIKKEERALGGANRKVPITRDHLLWLLKQFSVQRIMRAFQKGHQLSASDRDSLCIAGAVVVAWFFLLRSSEYLGHSDDEALSGDRTTGLRGEDVLFRLHGDVCAVTQAEEVVINIRGSKTDQLNFGAIRSQHRVPSAKDRGGEYNVSLCPVQAFEWLNAAFPERFASEKRKSLFTWADGKRITRHEVQAYLKVASVQFGVPPELVSTHSLRVGGATALYASGVELTAVRRFGRWASDAFQVYLYETSAATHQFAAKMAMESPLLLAETVSWHR